jgi:hypothetical protein
MAMCAMPRVTVTTLLALGACVAVHAGDPAWPPLPIPEIACRGCEHSGRFVEDNPGWGPHLVTLFCTGKNPDSPWQTAQQHLNWAKDGSHSYVADGRGALVVWAHPSDRDFDDITQLRGLTGIEICHGGDAGSRDRLWDRLLTWCVRNKRPLLWGFAADDTHSSTDIDKSWFAAQLQEPTEWNLKTALSAGRFYVSNGPVITDVDAPNGGPTVTLKLARPADIRWVKAGQYGIGPAAVTGGPGENHCLKIERNVTESSYSLSEDDSTLKPEDALFVRCIVTTAKKGEAAFAQPFVIRKTPDGLQLDSGYAREMKWYKGQTHNHSDLREGSEARVRDYYAAYAAKGQSCAFETGYDYWVMPFLRFPADRVPTIERVEPTRMTKEKVGKITIHGRAFPDDPKVVVSGGSLHYWAEELKNVRRVANDRIEVTLPASLEVGAYDVMVTKPFGLQDTIKNAFVVQPSADVNRGWTTFTPYNSKLGSRYTYSTVSDKRGGVWVATNNGLNHFDGKQWSLHRRGDGSDEVLTNTFYDVAVDADGAAWYTCFTGVGVLHPDGSNEQWPSPKIGVPNYQVNQVLRVGDTTFVTAMNRRGLFACREGKWQQVALPGDLGKGPKLTGLALDAQGRLWVGSEGGLLCWDRGKGDAGWKRYTSKDSGLADDHVGRLAFDGKGRLWVATATRQEGPVGGLCCLDGEKWTSFTPANSALPERRVWCVFVDGNDAVWAGTSKGIACRRCDGTWRVFTTCNSGLADDFVTDIAQDSQGDLWFTTANGVSRFSLAPASQPASRPG